MKLFNGRPNWSIKHKIMASFLPLIIISVLVVGILSYVLGIRQLRNNAVYLINNTVYQNTTIVNDKLGAVFLQADSIAQSTSLANLVLENYMSDRQSDRYNDIIAVNAMLNSLYASYYQMIDSIYFCTNHDLELNVIKEDTPTHIGLDLPDWLQKYSGATSGYYWLGAHDDTVFQTPDRRSVLSLIKTFGTPSSKNSGVLVVNLKSSYFLSTLEAAKISLHGYMILSAPSGLLFPSDIDPSFQLTDAQASLLKKRTNSPGAAYLTTAQSEKMLVVRRNLLISGWTLSAVVPEVDLTRDLSNLKLIILVLVGVMVTVSSIVTLRLAKNITNSIEYLSGQVRKFDSGNMDVNFQVRDTNEIGVLSNALSCLVDSVGTLLEEVRHEQDKKAKVELLALQSQIKPHFLYNTLGSIKHLIDLDKNDMASRMCGALTKFYMIGISKGKEIITVEQEIEHACNYLLIQKMRYGDKFSYDVQISDEIRNALVLKLTVQPVIENAIYHGIKNKTGPGFIAISGRREDEHIVIEVFDDGVGMDQQTLAELQRSIKLSEIEENPVTFGLRNVNQRIILHFGSQYGLTMESAEQVYTRVLIRFPFMQ